MKRILLAVLAALILCPSCQRQLTVVHFNDTHSHLDPLRDGSGGVIERAAIVDSIRRADGASNVLLLHAGDFNQGSSYFTVLGGELEIDLVNAMGYDCVCLGNHEFDNGIESLSDRLERLECPVVCANYDFSSFPMGEYVKPYAVLKKAGRRIGIIGLLCDLGRVVSKQTADRIPSAGSYAQVVNRYASILRGQEGCDMVIVLSHIGFEDDCQLVKSIRGVDLVVGGHSHTFLDAPEQVADLDGRIVPVVSDGCWGLQAGVLHWN